MFSTKRKAAIVDLQRRVRARREPSEELEAESLVSSSEGQSALIVEGDTRSREGSEESLEEDEASESEQNEPSEEGASISFGALAKVQATLKPASKRERPHTELDDDTWEDNEALERKAGWKDRRDFNRTNKHAPAELSSKKAVSRKREVVPIAKRVYRDPRFDSVAGPVDEVKFRKAYSFLDDYREDEMKELKAAIKTAKDEDAKEKLKRTLMAMESRKKAQIRKDKERQVLEKHRKEEKELVKQGKKPYYLKKPELKKRLLLDQYGELKGKKLDKVIERRRKKLEGKEKKKLPYKRRGVETQESM